MKEQPVNTTISAKSEGICSDCNAPPPGVSLSAFVSLKEFDRKYVHEVIIACGGNKTAAAKILGIDRKTLSRKMKPH